MASTSAAYREALEPVLLSLADDELVIGHRHSEWTGWAPHIEEDIAFSSIAQDEIGHANLFYSMLSEMTGQSADVIALGREATAYRHAIVCERPNGDWAYTLARHFLYDSADRIRLESLRSSSFKPLADAAEKVLREERYHQLHADAWFKRLAAGPMEGRHQFALALSQALPESIALFERLESETEALESGIWAEALDSLLQRWLSEVMERIEQAGLPVSLTTDSETGDVLPTSAGQLEGETSPHQTGHTIEYREGKWVLEGQFSMGGRYGKHSDDFVALWEDLTRTYREEPSATW